jgi:tetratricopeptide (TPR) repeat protein
MSNRTRALLHYHLSQWLSRFNMDGKAVEQLRLAVAADPECARAWRSLGFLLASRGEQAAGIVALLRALQLNPGDAVTRFNLGFILHSQMRLPEAIEQFEQVVAAAPKNDRAWYGLGLCLQESGDFAKSVVPLEHAARLQYFNPHAGYHLALAWHKLGERKKVDAEYLRVKSFDPKMAAQMNRDFGSHASA